MLLVHEDGAYSVVAGIQPYGEGKEVDSFNQSHPMFQGSWAGAESSGECAEEPRSEGVLQTGF